MVLVQLVWNVGDEVGSEEPVLLATPATAWTEEIAEAARLAWRNGDRWDGLLPEGYRWVREEVEVSP